MSRPVDPIGLVAERERRLRTATVSHFITEDGVRLAVVPDCPWCDDSHRYVVPEILATDATLTRDAKCGRSGKRGYSVRLTLPDDDSTAFTRSPDPGWIDLDADLRNALRRFKGGRR